MNRYETRALHAVPTLLCQGSSFYLKYLGKKGHNSNNITFRVMPIVLQLHLFMMSKYSKFGVDTFNTRNFFSTWATLKFLQDDNNNKNDDNDDDLAITIA